MKPNTVFSDDWIYNLVMGLSLLATPVNPNNERLARELHALSEVAKTLTLPLELPELLDAVMFRIIDVLDQADVGSIMLWDQSAGLFRPAASLDLTGKS